MHPAGTATVERTVENAGEVAGAEVVQLYYYQASPSVAQSVQQLLGFQRLELEPGERKRVTFEVTGDQLALLDRDMNRVVEPGEYEFRVGHSAADIRGRETLTVTGERWRVPHSARMYFTESEVS